MHIDRLSRRRVLVTAVAGGIIGGCARPRRFEWRGTALGANASLVLVGADHDGAQAAVSTVLDEIDRLEGEFSLYRPDSSLSRLNRFGRLDDPSPDWRAMLSLSRRIHHASDGAFDVTVQPLWAAVAGYLAREPHADHVPETIVSAARARVGMDRVRFDESAVVLGPGMALTFNGIAQGYICDRVADLLRSLGWGDVLVQLGEIRAGGAPGPGRDWSIATPGGRGVALSGGAIATSSGSAGRLNQSGWFHHLIEPHTATSPSRYSHMTAITASAAVADGISTAASFLTIEGIDRLARQFGASFEVVTADRRLIQVS